MMFGEDDACDTCGLDPCGCPFIAAHAGLIQFKPAPVAATRDTTRSKDTTARAPDARDTQTAPSSIDARFAEFHKANPHVGVELLRLARARLARGEQRIGTKALFEELRGVLSTQSPDYRLNNSHTSFYSRWLIQQDPRLADAIETRKRKSE